MKLLHSMQRLTLQLAWAPGTQAEWTDHQNKGLDQSCPHDVLLRWGLDDRAHHGDFGADGLQAADAYVPEWLKGVDQGSLWI